MKKELIISFLILLISAGVFFFNFKKENNEKINSFGRIEKKEQVKDFTKEENKEGKNEEDKNNSEERENEDFSKKANKNSQDNLNDKVFTKEEVSFHNKESDCWIIIDNKVYNVTSYIDLHKGGIIIVNYCGKDATLAFNTKGGKGKPHKPKAFEDLKKLYIGNLKK